MLWTRPPHTRQGARALLIRSGVGKGRPEFRLLWEDLCRTWKALVVILQCHSLQMPGVHFTVEKLFLVPFGHFLPLLPKRPSCCHREHCYRGLRGVVSTSLPWVLPRGLRAEPGHSWCSGGVCGLPELMKQLVRRDGQAESELESHSRGMSGITHGTGLTLPGKGEARRIHVIEDLRARRAVGRCPSV